MQGTYGQADQLWVWAQNEFPVVHTLPDSLWREARACRGRINKVIIGTEYVPSLPHLEERFGNSPACQLTPTPESVDMAPRYCRVPNRQSFLNNQINFI